MRVRLSSRARDQFLVFGIVSSSQSAGGAAPYGDVSSRYCPPTGFDLDYRPTILKFSDLVLVTAAVGVVLVFQNSSVEYLEINHRELCEC